MMRKNTISLAVGLTLLPATAFSFQDNIEQMQLPYVQETRHNMPMAEAIKRRNPIRNPVAPSIQLAQSDTSADSKQSSSPNQSNQYPLPRTTRNLEKMRVEKIKSIVSGANASAVPEQTKKQQSQPVEQTRNVSSPQQRRQQLKDLVVGSPTAKDLTNKSYVSKLQDEVSSTIVIDEESARRLAAPATTVGTGSEAAAPPKSDDAYLYTVRNGDSLWRIAKRFYRDPYRYVDLCRANREVLINEDILHVGQVLRVPKAIANN